MYQYHGWLSTLAEANAREIEEALKDINRPYPSSAAAVNGELHISFSGSPNRDFGQVQKIVDYLVSLNIKLSGCVYINDPDSERFNSFEVVKIVEDVATKIHDQNFTLEETKKIFE